MGRKERRRQGRQGRSATPRARSRSVLEKAEDTDAIPFTRWTMAFGGAGVVAVVLGFILLGQGSIALAPALLVVGFLILFPLSLVK